MIIDSGISKCGNARRGKRQDKQAKPLITKRQQKRKNVEEVNDFMAVMKGICPSYYGDL